MMKKDPETERDLSRRDFFKRSAFGIGATVIAGVAVVPAEAAKVKAAKTTKAEARPNTDPLAVLPAPAKWDYETDIAVAGGGGAGLAAAVSATEQGAKVIVLEKNAFCGGDTSIAMAFAGNCGSRLQTKLGLKKVPLSELVLNQSSHNITTPNPTCGRDGAFVRQIHENMGDTVNWLEDMGVVYSEKAGVIGHPVAGANHCPIDPEHPEEDWYGWYPHNARGFTEVLEKRAKNLKIRVLKEHPAIGLVTSGKGVVGIAARGADGKTVFVRAKAVILATGGFGANKDMLKKYCAPRRAEAVRYWGMPGATGDGIRMAQALGADLRQMEEIEIWDGGALHEHGSTTVYSAPNQLVRQKSLTVNKKGKRFFNEALYRGHLYSFQGAQTIAQPDMVSFTLFDSNLITREDIMKKLKPTVCEYLCVWYEKQFDEYLAKGVIKKASTIPDLAKQFGIDPDALVKTVDRYNQLCDEGADKDFFKEAAYMQPIRKAPFYAVGQKGGSCFNTWGGLVLDERFHVLDKEWDPVQGLFVAGENAAGGTGVSIALTGGRLAGKYAAKEVP